MLLFPINEQTLKCFIHRYFSRFPQVKLDPKNFFQQLKKTQAETSLDLNFFFE